METVIHGGTEVVPQEKVEKVVLIRDARIELETRKNQVNNHEVEVPKGIVMRLIEGGVTTENKILSVEEAEAEVAPLEEGATEEAKKAHEEAVKVARALARAEIRNAVRAQFMVKIMKAFGGKLYQGMKIPQAYVMANGWAEDVRIPKPELNQSPKAYIAKHGAELTKLIDEQTSVIVSSMNVCADFESLK